jgi:hypothetical protein
MGVAEGRVGRSVLSLGTFVRKGLQVDGITCEETYMAQDAPQTQTFWYHDVW